MNILVLAPYKAMVLKAITALEKINLCHLNIIGDKSLIERVCLNENIVIGSKIIDIENEENIIIEAFKYISLNTIVIFGEIQESNQNRLLDIKEDNCNYFYVLDINELRHFVFISNHSKKRHLNFEDKKIAIQEVFDFMKVLGVKKSNVGVLTDKLNKTDILEVNLIRMILQEEISKNVNVLSPCTINQLFNKSYYNNIYLKNINMLIFKNYDISKTFIDTLKIFSNSKVASICKCCNKPMYFIDTIDQRSEEDILFSILLIDKFLSSNKTIKNVTSKERISI